MKICAVIPAYNEAENVEDLSNRLNSALKQANADFELIYVIQGNDGALEKLQKMQNDIPQIKLFYFPEPIGVGPAFIEGFNKISPDCDYVLTMDADLNHQPEELPRFIEAMEKSNCDIVIGSRKIKGGVMERMPLTKKIISGVTNIIMPVAYGFNVNDMTSGYRLYKRKVIEDIRNKITSRNFEFYPEALIQAKKTGHNNMVEVPITFTFRIHGKSKLNWTKTGIGYLRLLIKRFKW